MYKRVVILFSCLIICLSVCIFRIYSLSNGQFLATAASKQGLYKLKVAQYRGNIYDCNKRPLLYKEEQDVAAISPGIKVAGKLNDIFKGQELNLLLKQISNGKPFIVPLSKPVYCDGINNFKVAARYSENQILPHVIGYIDSEKNGVCGIERAYNSYLNDDSGSIYVKYKVDALNRTLADKNILVDDTSYKHTKGVVLTIDERIQKIIQSIALTNMERGAIVITEVPNCEIKACVSMPNFSPNNISQSLNLPSCPLINRAFGAYNIGSVFKLVTAAAALESSIDGDQVYNCTGEINVSNRQFHCFNNKAHESTTMKSALANSCNTYFVDITKKMRPSKLLELSMNLGFSKSIELAPGLVTSKGNLPSKKELKEKGSLANFSFGQGSLMATPVQVAGLLNTIANGGLYYEPKLVKGIVNENLEYILPSKKEYKKRVISSKNSAYLIDSMKESVETGTSKKGKPENLSAGAKTGSAQTGIMVENRYVTQAWYAGIYPIEKPKYSIVVFVEDGKGGGETCGPIFKKIVDELYQKLPEYFN